MNSNQLYPFQRNRYYSGKLLASADFQAEQDYFNNKERFVNSLMFGSGIVCGLGVVSLDDVSILVESGVAIDGMGREIIQESSAVKKLSAIEGFDELTGDDVILGIKFHEEPVHSVYAVNRSQTDKEFEYSRISENSTLFLIDKAQAEGNVEIPNEFLTQGVIYEDPDFKVYLVAPSTVSKARPVKLELCVDKKTETKSKLTIQGTLQLPGFMTADDLQEIEIDLNDISLELGGCVKKEYWLNVIKSELDSTMIILKSGTGQGFINDEAVLVNPNFEMRLMLSEAHPREIVNTEIGRTSLEMRNLGGFNEYIQLAEITLVRTAGSYYIEKIQENNIKKYITSPAQGLLRGKYMDYFTKDTELKNSDKVTRRQEVSSTTSNAAVNRLPEISTGVLEIPLGNGARKGDIRYSGEIVHGLGSGNVYVEVGYESVTEDPALGANARNTIFGNPDLFRKDKAEAPMIETAIKVLNDKGSFVVAAKLMENVDYLVLTYRWVAIRFPAGDDLGLVKDFSGKSIVPETPTVVLETRESHFFGVRFVNMESCSLMYELTEEGSGEITTDGIYTAPAKEGVYEIRVYCTDMPMVCAYAYAIVKKKGSITEEQKEPAMDKGTVLDELSLR